MRRELSNYHLNIHIKNDIVSITGIAKDKRKVIIDLVNDEIKENFFSIENTNDLFTTVDLKDIEKIVLKILNRHEFFLDTYSLFNYVLHLALTIEIKKDIDDLNQSISKNQEKLQIMLNEKISNIVTEVYNELKLLYNSNYTIYDIQQASILLMTRIVTLNYDEIEYSQMNQIVGDKVINLINDIVISVKNTYAINLSNDGFLVRFAMHVSNLLTRLMYDVKITNLQFSTIKNDYPLIYAISVHIAKIISDHCGKALSEDEISYICLHVGLLMSESKDMSDKVKAIIVCPDYFSLGKKIFKKLSDVCKDNLLISNVVTYLDESIDLSNIELIISTVKLDPSILIPKYTVSPLLSQTDFQNIFEITSNIKEKRKKRIMKEKFQYFFHDDLFFSNQSFLTEKDAIETMCDAMVKNGYVEKNYKSQIYEHEDISSSSYGNIAIPHPLNNNALSTAIAVSLNYHAFQWGTNKVNIVFMLSLKEEDKDYFSDIFEFIDIILKDEKQFSKIISITNYDDFINYLISVY